jgi:general secretion pathway protein D
MKTTPQSVRCRASRACRAEVWPRRVGCNPLGNQQKETKLAKVRPFASFVIFCFILASLSLVCVSSFAQTPDNVAEREVQRRQAGISQGEAALARGQAAMKAKDYGAAHEEFRTAVTYLPDAVVSGKAHDEAVEGFCKSGVVLAEARIAEGRYADAEAILSELLSDRYDPKCRAAQELYAHLRQPGYFNKTMSPTFIDKVEKVKRLLTEADGYYQSGRYDLAFKRYEEVLAEDPYNTAARKGQEKINNTKYKYGEEAYNETRSRQLWQVEKGWEQPVRRYGQTLTPMAGVSARDTTGTARVTRKLNTIILPQVEFRDASLREAVDFLRGQAVENDTATEGMRGVNIVLRLGRPGAVVPPPAPGPAAPAAAGSAPPAGGVTAGGTAPVGAPPVATGPIAPAATSPEERLHVTLTLNQIPLGDALRYVAAQAGLKMKVESHAVLLMAVSEQSDQLITKRYHVPPEFFGGPLDVGYYLSERISQSALIPGPGGQATQPLLAGQILDRNKISTTAGSAGGGVVGGETTLSTRQQLYNDRQLVARAGAESYLQSLGVLFPEFHDDKGNFLDRASATFIPQSSTLIVRNTQDNLDLVDALVEETSRYRPKQVEIESKFVEINQNNLKELGFDWLLGPFSINGKVFGSGGTAGNGVPVNPANFPFVNPVTNQPIGQNPVTSGNRNGDFAISANALDALLVPGLGQAAGAAPGIFGLAGVFTNPQFQVVIRALNQKKGIDLLSAPRVTTKSGQRAIIEVVREFRYPKTYTPPQVPQIGSTTGGNNNVVPVVVTPTTPQDWETRNTGVTLEVEPVVGEDATTIDLNLVPQVVEFEGFINYGSPINAVGVNTIGGAITTSVPVLLTQNVINQPVFSTRKVTTSVSVYDGQTVVLGGLMREDVQKVEDKTPIIGDIPLIGRAFRTNVDQHVKKNLVIFVTARVITPSGLAFNNEEEEEEGLLPPALPEVPAYKK